jgi:hypothetical protein
MVVSWTPLERARRMAFALKGVYLVPGRGKAHRPAPLRYALQAVRTAMAVARRRPSVVIYTNPPFVAGLVLAGLRLLFRFRLWADVHSGALNDPRWARFHHLNSIALQLGDGIVLPHEGFSARFEGRNLNLCVVNMPGAVDRGANQGGHGYLVAPVSYSFDEPVSALLEALRSVPDCTVIFTGNAPRSEVDRAPSNAQFSGWLERNEYDALLADSDGVVCLTDRGGTMQMGAYEGAEHGVPLLLSDTPILRRFFAEGGAVFVADHRPETIARGLRALVRDARALLEDAEQMRQRLLTESIVEIEDLRRHLDLSE